MEQAAISGADTGWMLVATAMVLLMAPALGLFYGGMVRSKNVLNTAMMCLGSMTVGVIVWTALGFSLAYGGDGLLLGGLRHAMLRGIGLSGGQWGAFPDLLFVAFQAGVAILAAGLISGALVERVRFGPFMVFAGLWIAVVYAPVAHWVWGGGWLARLGVIDFAGGIVVHVSAGAAAIAAATVVGPRKDFGRRVYLPHNVPHVLLGAALIWFGGIGFNAGRALGATPTAALALLNTLLAPAAALLVWLILDSAGSGKMTAIGAATAIVVGLVAIAPAAGFVGPSSALLIGALAAAPSYWAILLRARSGLDDSLDVFSAHAVGGMVGAMLTAVFADAAWGGPDGVLRGDPLLLVVQALGILAVAAYGAAVSYGLLKGLSLFVTLRKSDRDEGIGLDIVLHGEEAYSRGEGAVLLLPDPPSVPDRPRPRSPRPASREST